MPPRSESRSTIFAPATAAGRAAVAIVRVSGPGAGFALAALCGHVPGWQPRPRKATRVRLVDPVSNEPIDDALVLWFPGPRSFTGEDMAELHLHGSRAVVEATLAALRGLPGLRLAEAGEFTRRAFDAGKLDLAEVEGLADLVAAETRAQARQALRQLSGALGKLTEAWRARLVRALAHAEAEIDFPEENLPGGLLEALRPDLEKLAVELSAHLDDDRRGERLRDGIAVAIIGPPNAGKSSLLNRIARRDASIVSSVAGTTRDVIEVALDLGGYPVTIADTAGLRDLPAQDRDSHETIEREGITRALARAETADFKLLVLDATSTDPGDTRLRWLIDDNTFVVVNKVDVARPGFDTLEGRKVWPVSAATGRGLATLIEALSRAVADRLHTDAAAAPLVTRARHRAALEEGRSALQRVIGAPATQAPELVAEDLRLAARALGRITGRVAVDDVLDVIFKEFCIGK